MAQYCLLNFLFFIYAKINKNVPKKIYLLVIAIVSSHSEDVLPPTDNMKK